jgi:hypothetical protein
MDPLIDQTFFSNAKKAQHIESPTIVKKGKKPYSKTDFKLYRKDIFSLTKDLINRKNKDEEIIYYFDEFIQHAIEYLKFKEKETQIQETYADLDMNSKSSHAFNTPKSELFNKVEESNMLMYKDYNLKTISMDQFVKKKHIKEVQPLHIPAQKQIKHKERVKKTDNNKRDNKQNVSVSETTNTQSVMKEPNKQIVKKQEIDKNQEKQLKQQNKKNPNKKKKTMKIEI